MRSEWTWDEMAEFDKFWQSEPEEEESEEEEEVKEDPKKVEERW